jgi:endonuclease-8
VPEGDTIAWAAKRIRPVLAGQVPDEILTPQPRHTLDRWPERLAGRAVRSVDTHGKHLFIRFDGALVIHSHLGMLGSWIVDRGAGEEALAQRLDRVQGGRSVGGGVQGPAA